MDQEHSLEKQMDMLPKYICYDGDYYPLVIWKNDWDGHPNAWIFMYALGNEESLSTTRSVIRVEGHTFPRALYNLQIALNQYRELNKDNPRVTRM
jgi:hypothetical protein